MARAPCRSGPTFLISSHGGLRAHLVGVGSDELEVGSDGGEEWRLGVGEVPGASRVRCFEDVALPAESEARERK